MNTIIVVIAQYCIGLSALIVLWAWFALPHKDRLKLLADMIVAGILALLISKLAAHFYFDPRPFTINHQIPLFAHAPDNGFPSDHTTLSMLVALAIVPFSRKAGGILIIISLLIGLARVLSLVHSPIDIAGSIVIAALSVYVARIIVRSVYKVH